MSDYRREGLLFNVTYAEPQAATHLQHGSTTIDGIPLAASEER